MGTGVISREIGEVAAIRVYPIGEYVSLQGDQNIEIVFQNRPVPARRFDITVSLSSAEALELGQVLVAAASIRLEGE